MEDKQNSSDSATGGSFTISADQDYQAQRLDGNDIQSNNTSTIQNNNDNLDGKQQNNSEQYNTSKQEQNPRPQLADNSPSQSTVNQEGTKKHFLAPEELKDMNNPAQPDQQATQPPISLNPEEDLVEDTQQKQENGSEASKQSYDIGIDIPSSQNQDESSEPDNSNQTQAQQQINDKFSQIQLEKENRGPGEKVLLTIIIVLIIAILVVGGLIFYNVTV